jgi:hypothetical protein
MSDKSTNIREPVVRLPTKPSVFLRAALDDLRLCEKDPTYRINMRKWHQRDSVDEDDPSKGLVCFVCLTGAYMAQTLKVLPNHTVVPYEVADYIGVTMSYEDRVELSKKLLSLNSFRIGTIKDALRCWGYGDVSPEIPVDVTISPYEGGAPQFYFDMEHVLIPLLERHGY